WSPPSWSAKNVIKKSSSAIVVPGCRAHRPGETSRARVLILEPLAGQPRSVSKRLSILRINRDLRQRLRPNRCRGKEACAVPRLGDGGRWVPSPLGDVTGLSLPLDRRRGLA